MVPVHDMIRGAFAGAIIGNSIGSICSGMTHRQIHMVTGGRGITGLRAEIYDTDGHDYFGRETRIGSPDANSLSLFREAESMISDSEDRVRDEELSECGVILRSFPAILMRALKRDGQARLLEDLKHGSLSADTGPLAYLAAASLAPLLSWSISHRLPFVNVPSVLEEVMRAIDFGMKSAAGSDPTATEHYDALYTTYRRAIGGFHAHAILRARTGSRTTLQEAVPFIALVSMRNMDDFRVAMIEVTNAGGDSSAIGTAVGAIVGANSGIGVIPEEFTRMMPEDTARAIEIADRFIDKHRTVPQGDEDAGLPYRT